MSLNLIIGHSNMDPDCIASMVIGRYIYPDHIPVLSRFLHPAAKNIVNLFEKELAFMNISELKGKEVNSLVIMDTRKHDRVKEFFREIDKLPPQIIVYDHHRNEICDIEGSELKERDCGANVTFLVLLCRERKIAISPTDATIALAGIYADTGYFKHSGTNGEDFAAAAYLVEQGASITLIGKILKSIQDDSQIDVFHEMVKQMVYQEINGHFLIVTYLVLPEQVGGLAAVVEKLSEVESPDALFAVFNFEDSGNNLIISRSTKNKIHVNEIMQEFGGGGHGQAASALVKKRPGRNVLQELLTTIKKTLHPAVTAKKIMTENPSVMEETISLLDASKFFEKVNHSGAPVVDSTGELKGFITLKDIMKGRKNDNMHAPVKAYMRRKCIQCTPDTTIREIEHLLYKNNIGHLPVAREGILQGIITRTDVLNFLKSL